MMLQFSRSYAHLRGLQGVMMPTPMLREDEIERKWFVVDADGQVLGRLASRVAAILRGKHKPAFAPHMDRSEEHTSELQSHSDLVCRLLLEKKNKTLKKRTE